MPPKINLIGQSFGRWSVLECSYTKKNQIYWKCECACGTIRDVAGGSLRGGSSKSCGCLNREITSKLMSNRILSEETKLKIGKSSKGRWSGKKHSKETIEKMSGKNSYSYKHGLAGTKEYMCAAAQKRRASKLNQTPDNANLQKIQLYYIICAYLNEPCETPMWHVDHIKPISKGGLHHEDNLQILTAAINLEKHNKYPLSEDEKMKYTGIKI